MPTPNTRLGSESTSLRKPTSLSFCAYQRLAHAQAQRAPPCANQRLIQLAFHPSLSLCSRTPGRMPAPLIGTIMSKIRNNNFASFKILMNQHLQKWQFNCLRIKYFGIFLLVLFLAISKI